MSVGPRGVGCVTRLAIPSRAPDSDLIGNLPQGWPQLLAVMGGRRVGAFGTGATRRTRKHTLLGVRELREGANAPALWTRSYFFADWGTPIYIQMKYAAPGRARLF